MDWNYYRQRYGPTNVIMSDIRKPPQEILESGKNIDVVV